MKTTIDIPESLYTTLAAASSAEGLTLEDFVLKAARDRVKDLPSESPPSIQLRDVPAIAEYYQWLDSRTEEERQEIREAVAEVQAIIDEEFSRIDPRDWE
jgi:uncharacterized protein (DUF1778 family)